VLSGGGAASYERNFAVKKAFLPLAVALFVLLVPSLATALPGETDVTPLSNKDVLGMVQQHLPEEAIIKAIKTSPCTFDTFPPVLKDMKRRGVSDGILQAMIEAPYGPTLHKTSKDELGDQTILHYADQLKQMGFMVPSQVNGRVTQFPRQTVRSSRGSSRLPVQ
jgi:hypothetical protein